MLARTVETTTYALIPIRRVDAPTFVDPLPLDSLHLVFVLIFVLVGYKKEGWCCGGEDKGKGVAAAVTTVGTAASAAVEDGESNQLSLLVVET